ncbi:hypothetical protein MANES_03G204500v8 [Manihot esculenta]|uniref:Uncharacterized protein n=1 Tax=Manihot esculenta TaxID=3983 RepID=A0ACB7I1I4_MANES|nr:hypothetical protein MANES_03G204500v8 [Manihot esculenta]
MVDKLEKKVHIREYNENRDIKVVGKLDKNCGIGSKMTPYVAELSENGELVGVVRGCIKCVGTRFGATYVRLGYILGLRVSPKHRMGIGLKLVKLSVEEWLVRNGPHNTFLATDNCNYINFSSLVIFVQPASLPVKGLSQDSKIEKLQMSQAISLYNNRLRGKDIYPTDIDAVLMEKLSLEWIILHSKNNEEDIISQTPSSWEIFSVWNSCEAYKLHIRKSHHNPLKFFHATLSHARDKIFPCVKLPICESLQKPLGFLFLYGLYGEGERLQELMKSIWSFASRLAENAKDCKMIVTEKVNGLTGTVEDNEQQVVMEQVGNAFVDLKDF